MSLKRTLLVGAGFLLFVGAAVASVALWRNLNREPSTVLTNPCAPPCWHGIQPGEMTSVRVLGILMELPWVSQGIHERIRNYPRSDELIHLEWYFTRPAPDAYGYAYFDEDLCTAISILAFGSLTVADAFGRFGEPEFMWVHTEEVDGRAWVEVTLLYGTSGVVVEVNVDGTDQDTTGSVEITANSPVWRVTYFDPTRFEGLLGTEILINESAETREGDLMPWPGLGTIPYERAQRQPTR